jgi:hypothetical protein
VRGAKYYHIAWNKRTPRKIDLPRQQQRHVAMAGCAPTHALHGSAKSIGNASTMVATWEAWACGEL